MQSIHAFSSWFVFLKLVLKSAVSVHQCLVRGRIYIIFFIVGIYHPVKPLQVLCGSLHFLDFHVELLCFLWLGESNLDWWGVIMALTVRHYCSHLNIVQFSCGMVLKSKCHSSHLWLFALYYTSCSSIGFSLQGLLIQLTCSVEPFKYIM